MMQRCVARRIRGCRMECTWIEGCPGMGKCRASWGGWQTLKRWKVGYGCVDWKGVGVDWIALGICLARHDGHSVAKKFSDFDDAR